MGTRTSAREGRSSAGLVGSCIGALFVLLHIGAHLDAWLTTSCTGRATMLFYVMGSWLPVSFGSLTGLVVSAVGLRGKGRRRWALVGVLVNGLLLIYIGLVLARVIPFPRHPCMR